MPTLGIVILTLFLLEEYCSSFRTKFDEEDSHSDASHQPRENKQRDKPETLTGPIRVNLLDQKGLRLLLCRVMCWKI